MKVNTLNSACFKLGHFNPSTNPFWMEDNINHLCLNHGRPPPSRTRPLVQITVQSSSDLGQVPVPLKEALGSLQSITLVLQLPAL